MSDEPKGSAAPLSKSEPAELTPEVVVEKLTTVLHKAIETDAETHRYRLDKEADAYETALKYEDRADARAHEIEKAQLAAAMNNRSQSRRYGAGLVVLVFAFATGLAMGGHVRESMELVATAAAAGLGFFGGRSVGREQGRRVGEARAREDSNDDKS